MKRSDLNQREYCKVNDLPLKRFGNWCAQFRREPRPELLDLLAAAERLLGATGSAVALCPNFGTGTVGVRGE